MNESEVSIYLREANTQAGLAIGAAIALNNALQSSNEESRGTAINWDRKKFIHGEIFRSLHSLLTHASNISKLFWPSATKGKTEAQRIARGQLLRGRLGLPDNGHTLQDRRFRNHLEHFDERLDNWRETSSRKNYVQDFIGPKGSIFGVEETDIMRWFDPQSKQFVFRGETFDIQELITSIEGLIELITPNIEAF